MGLKEMQAYQIGQKKAQNWLKTSQKLEKKNDNDFWPIWMFWHILPTKIVVTQPVIDEILDDLNFWKWEEKEKKDLAKKKKSPFYVFFSGWW